MAGDDRGVRSDDGGSAQPPVLSQPGGVVFERMVGALISGSRAEPGCVSCRLYDSREAAGAVIFVGEKTSREALDEHFTTPHFTTFGDALPGMTGQPGDLRIFDVSGLTDA